MTGRPDPLTMTRDQLVYEVRALRAQADDHAARVAAATRPLTAPQPTPSLFPPEPPDRPQAAAARPARVQARADDPTTSKLAAQRHRAQRGQHRQQVLDLYRATPAGLTAREAGQRLPSVPGAWKRVSELLADGLLTDSGHVRDNSRVLTFTPPNTHQKGER